MLPTDLELLAELSTFDECEVMVPGSVDVDRGSVPAGTELVMQVRRFSDEDNRIYFPVNVQLPMTRHDGEYLIESLHTTLHPNAGGTTADMLWLELDDAVNRIQRRVVKGRAPRNSDVGEARGLATAIAIMLNPYAYDVDAVKDEAMARWDARNPGSGTEDD